MTENTNESLAIGWLYQTLSVNAQTILERTIRRAATFEDAKRTIRLCFTADWARQNIRVRAHPEESVFQNSEMRDISFKNLDWDAVTQTFWDRLRKRNYHYSQIHTIMYGYTVGIFSPSQHSHLIITDDPKIVKDWANTRRFTIREPLVSVKSKDKTEELKMAIERVKRLSSNPSYSNVLNSQYFSCLVSIGCVDYELHYPRPIYKFEGRL